MFIFFWSLFICLMIVTILKLISMLISEKSLLQREELSAYECGFEHHNVSRIPFSLRYFFLTLIFLLFDLEIVFLILLPSLLFTSSFYFIIFFSCLFIFFLLLSLIYEWVDGSLEWMK